MASTPSAALRLELMATGDQSGTWGDTTNTNLGTLLEQAITGYLSVAQGDVANLTLTTTNYASDQARNAVIRVTGALTATRNVVIQTANKLYTIANDTTGGFSIVVKTSGGTGVSVPPGAMMNIYSDGTNAVMGQNYWNGSIGGAIYLDAGAAVGPNYDLFRDSTSPAASDILGRVTWNGRDSAANKQEYASIETVISDPTSTSEDAALNFYVVRAGTRTLAMAIGAANTGPFSVVRAQVFTASGTYTPHANMVYCWARLVGSGGAGGGAGAATGQVSVGGGGGAGGYAEEVYSAATIGASQTVTVGVGGTGVAAAGGNNGNTTSLGALLSATGGTGGGTSGSGAAVGVLGGAAGIGSGGDINLRGGTGLPAAATVSPTFILSGAGGSSQLGGGGLGVVSQSSGGVGGNYGGGGGGAGSFNLGGNVAGGAGADGVVVIVEFCSA